MSYLERHSIVVPLGGMEHTLTRAQAVELVRMIEEQLDRDVTGSPLGVIVGASPGVRFAIPGHFKPWERARRAGRGSFTSEASAHAQEGVAVYATRAVQIAKQLGVRWSGLERVALAIRVRWERDDRRRDLDNVAKQVAEGLMRTAGVVLADDSQIDRLTVERLPPGKPGVEVFLRRKDGP